MSKKYQIFLACGLVAATTRLFAASDYVQLQQQVISNDSILKSLQQSQHAYAINQKYAGRLNNPTFNLELENKSIEVSNLIDSIKNYDQSILPATKESLRIAEMGYQAGKISLLEFNTIKQIWLDKHLARFDLWLALQNQIAEVERNYVTNLNQE